jgi:hypothetical protein
LTTCWRRRISESGVCPRALTCEVVLEVRVTLGERVARKAGFLGQGDDRQRAVGVLRGSLQDAVHGRADTVAFVGCGAHAVPS